MLATPDVRPAHILVALLDQSDGIASPLLKAVGVDPSNVRAQAQMLVDRMPTVAQASATPPQLSRESIAAVSAAQQLAGELGDEYVSTEHIVVGLATGDSDVAKLLHNAGATPPRNCGMRSSQSAGADASRARTRSRPTRRSRSTRPT